jgi:hypothetical protein
MKPTLILVGGDKGGTGKTTISRAMMDYLSRRNVPTRAFDTEYPRGTLQRFHPGNTEIIDLENVAMQMKILDTMETSKVPVTIVDLRAGILTYALDIFDKIGVLEAAKEGMFNLCLIHVIGPSIASLDEIGEIAKYVTAADYVLARNFINETNFFEWDQKTYKHYFSHAAQDIEIPKLNEMAFEQVDLARVSFRDFIDNKAADGSPGNFSFVLRGYLRKWISDIDAQFDKLKTMRSLTKARPAPVVAAAQ